MRKPAARVVIASLAVLFVARLAFAQTIVPTGSMNVPRSNHTLTLLPDGRVLAAGGVTTSAVVTSTAEIYDPATGTWTLTGSMMTPRS